MQHWRRWCLGHPEGAFAVREHVSCVDMKRTRTGRTNERMNEWRIRGAANLGQHYDLIIIPCTCLIRAANANPTTTSFIVSQHLSKQTPTGDTASPFKGMVPACTKPKSSVLRAWTR